MPCALQNPVHPKPPSPRMHEEQGKGPAHSPAQYSGWDEYKRLVAPQICINCGSSQNYTFWPLLPTLSHKRL